MNDIMHRKHAQGILKKVSEGGRRLIFANSSWPCVRCTHGLGQMEKSGVSLSLCRKTFKLKKVISFVPELRSPKCFCVSGFLCSMYICYEHSMYISIYMYGYATLPLGQSGHEGVLHIPQSSRIGAHQIV